MARREPAGFVEFLIRRQVALGHDAEQPAALEHRGDVVELVLDGPRQPDHRETGEARAALLDEADQRFAGGVQQDGLLKQVGAGVAGQGQFGEDDDVDLLLFGAGQEGEDRVGVAGAVGHAQPRHGGGDADETVLDHERTPSG